LIWSIAQPVAALHDIQWHAVQPALDARRPLLDERERDVDGDERGDEDERVPSAVWSARAVPPGEGPARAARC